VTTPAVIIRIPLEHPVSVYMDATNDGEGARLLDWVNAHPDLVDLVHRAFELADRERAA
jgi:hypothetical protein